MSVPTRHMLIRALLAALSFGAAALGYALYPAGDGAKAAAVSEQR
jgi:hypothetical protein